MSQSGYSYGNPNRSYGGPASYPSHPGPYQPSHPGPYHPPPSTSTFGMAQPRSSKTDSGFSVGVKYALLSLNFIFILIGGAGVGVGIWIIVRRDYMSYIYGNVLMTVAAYIVVVCGGILFLVAFVGCLGAFHYRKHKCLLLFYLVVTIAIAVFLLIAAVLALVFRTQVQDAQMYQIMRESIGKNYGVDLDKSRYNQLITQSWDSAQIELRCCAVEDENWNIYESSNWYKSQPGPDDNADNSKNYVPESCCTTDVHYRYIDLNKCQNPPEGQPPRAKAGSLEYNDAVNYRGCFDAGKEHVARYSITIIGMGIGALVLLIAAILCAFFLVCKAPESKYGPSY